MLPLLTGHFLTDMIGQYVEPYLFENSRVCMRMLMERLAGKRLGVLLIAVDQPDRDDVCAISGIVAKVGGEWSLQLESGQTIPLPDNTEERLEQATNEDARQIFDGAEYYIAMSVGPLPEDAKPDEYRPIGLRWPRQDE
jgi:hypothetical protein